MANTDVQALGRSDLNGFLFAGICEEPSGMTLSVLSALARLGLDPWQEAARLATLPRSAAIDGLAKEISSLPTGTRSIPDAKAVAARLVALLPARGAAQGSAMSAVATARTAVQPGSASRLWLLVLGLLGVLLVGLSFNTMGQRAAGTQPALGPPISHSAAQTHTAPPPPAL